VEEKYTKLKVLFKTTLKQKQYLELSSKSPFAKPK